MNTKIFFILLWCAYLPARPIIVAQDGSGDYSTIQQAIDHFTPRDHTYQTIFIKKGIYKEKISIGQYDAPFKNQRGKGGQSDHRVHAGARYLAL